MNWNLVECYSFSYPQTFLPTSCSTFGEFYGIVNLCSMKLLKRVNLNPFSCHSEIVKSSFVCKTIHKKNEDSLIQGFLSETRIIWELPKKFELQKILFFDKA